MAEALTQGCIAKVLGANPGAGVQVPRVYMAFSSDDLDYPTGYIVMEYIDAPDCDERDYELVAKAVQTLISVPGLSSAPGPVGGGRIIHTFFMEWTSAITRVNLVADTNAGLRLCPCDINPGNFKKCQDGAVVALDFRATCFLPPSFFAVTMVKARDSFSRKVARRFNYPKSDDVEAMVSASYYLVPFGRNDIGLHQRKRL
ncbi:hypothetical protein M407DRAFT_246939 [Tulasnella calospora MUT 4182]|uniref:Aminoglycoside phosphotransferase domain-containing protein n=1 Tax=Tulasnella calospora MUT 4182 TaxID=1051891 RepID=A0A0C3K5K0_9AGAM|nr:hypothetical protein M407DRAFT_246939 [Tulasnella calospora MUT 4182]